MPKDISVLPASLLSVLLLTAPAMGAVLPVNGEQIRNLGIRTAPATPAKTSTAVSVLGRVSPAPNARVPVAAPFAGTVKALIALEGAMVKKGEPMIAITSADMRDALGKYESAQAHYRTARAAADRASALVKEGIAPASRAEAADADAAAAAAELAALRSTMGRAVRDGAGEYSLVAPADGRIAGISVSAGDQVSATQPVLVLDTGDELWVEAALPASQIGLVAAGDRAQGEDMKITGTVVAAGSSIDPKTRSAVVRIRLDKAGGANRLVVGQTLRLSISAAAGRGSFNVPRSAVTHLNGSDVVFAARKGGFEPVPVRVQAQGPAMTTISGALSPREAVAISGVSELKALGLRD
ncbi:MAG: efflux RND transporter periplasmic adaptor subunit [Alphaproteobacteria bacterium]|nr:efflux RND transporter periplasmic adaptor subunit [Alphaproteobacteria bacterium]